MNTALGLKFIRRLCLPEKIPDDFWGFHQLDDEYIAVFTYKNGQSEEVLPVTGCWTAYFVSTKTFQIERSMGIVRKFGYLVRYERGFLVLGLRDNDM